jgi:hypothetical protein
LLEKWLNQWKWDARMIELGRERRKNGERVEEENTHHVFS